MPIRRALIPISCIALALACAPRADVDLRQADRHIEANELDAAIALLQGFRAQVGPRSDVALRLGRAYEAKNDASSAVVLYKECVEAHPGAADVWLQLASVYADLAQFPRARDAFDKARAHGVADDRMALAFGVCLGRMGDYDAAEAELLRAARAGVDATIVDYNRSLVLVQKRSWLQALELLEGVVQKLPDYQPALRELARTLILQEPRDEAAIRRGLKLAWQAVEKNPEDWRAHEVLGAGYLALQDWEAATEALIQALRLGGNPPSVEEKYVAAQRLKLAAEGDGQR